MTRIILPVILLLLSSVHYEAEAYKILISTPLVGSHILGKLTLGKALVEKGHEVYLAVSERYPKLDSIRKAGIKPILYAAPPDSFQMDSEEGLKLLADIVFSDLSPKVLSKQVSGALHDECQYLMEDNATLDKIKLLNVDAVIAEPFLPCPCSMLIGAYLDKPLITLSLGEGHWERRVPALPSFAAQIGAPLFQENFHKHNLFSKLKHLSGYLLFTFPSLLFPGHKTDLIEKYTPQYSSWSDIVRQSQLFLGEGDFRLGNFIPRFPNHVNVAGMTAGPAKPLKDDLEGIMQASGDHGVILVSFGASGYSMPAETVKKFLDAFSRISHTVLARFNVTDGVQVPKNVKILKWLPQNNLLGHPSTKLFLTHCGSAGQYEGLYHGVPMLGFPWYAEQHSNCERAEGRGYGLTLDIKEFTPDQLVEAIREMMTNPNYKARVEEASARWRDEWARETPLERGVFWVEHVIKFGGSHLRPPSLELSLIEFLMLDVLAVVLLLLGLMLVLVLYLGKVVYRKNRGLETDVKIKTN